MLKEKLHSGLMPFIAINPILSFCPELDTPQFQFTVIFMILTVQIGNPGCVGIWTHSPEETGALNQLLRPIGHANGHQSWNIWGKFYNLLVKYALKLNITLQKNFYWGKFVFRVRQILYM